MKTPDPKCGQVTEVHNKSTELEAMIKAYCEETSRLNIDRNRLEAKLKEKDVEIAQLKKENDILSPCPHGKKLLQQYCRECSMNLLDDKDGEIVKLRDEILENDSTVFGLKREIDQLKDDALAEEYAHKSLTDDLNKACDDIKKLDNMQKNDFPSAAEQARFAGWKKAVSDLQGQIAMLRNAIDSFRIDGEAHKKGRCSFPLLALCSAAEQRVKMYFTKAMENV